MSRLVLRTMSAKDSRMRRCTPVALSVNEARGQRMLHFGVHSSADMHLRILAHITFSVLFLFWLATIPAGCLPRVWSCHTGFDFLAHSFEVPFKGRGKDGTAVSAQLSFAILSLSSKDFSANCLEIVNA